MSRYIETQEELETHFTKEYYETINYIDYEKRQEKYDRTAGDIVNLFDIKPFDYILDYGCATGMLMQSLKNQEVSVFGYDISEYALEKATEKDLFVSNDKGILDMKQYYLTIVLDVFEHMFDNEVEGVLKKLNTDFILVRLPVKLEGENDFHLEVSRKDPSHVNCKTESEWNDKFWKYGYRFVEYVNEETIYNSDGCYCAFFEKV
jgi:SAM-dependent methyltransferase